MKNGVPTCGLCMWLGFLTAWRLWDSWTSYSVAWGFRFVCCREQAGSCSAFYDPGLEVICHPSCCALYWLKQPQAFSCSQNRAETKGPCATVVGGMVLSCFSPGSLAVALGGQKTLGFLLKLSLTLLVLQPLFSSTSMMLVAT